MVVVQIEFLTAEVNEWRVSSWQHLTPTIITTTSFPDVEDALREALRLFQVDLDVDNALEVRAQEAVLAANAATVTTNKNTLRTADGL